jgi:hypothetical protein
MAILWIFWLAADVDCARAATKKVADMKPVSRERLSMVGGLRWRVVACIIKLTIQVQKGPNEFQNA